MTKVGIRGRDHSLPVLEILRLAQLIWGVKPRITSREEKRVTLWIIPKILCNMVDGLLVLKTTRFP